MVVFQRGYRARVRTENRDGPSNTFRITDSCDVCQDSDDQTLAEVLRWIPTSDTWTRPRKECEGKWTIGQTSSWSMAPGRTAPVGAESSNASKPMASGSGRCSSH